MYETKKFIPFEDNCYNDALNYSFLIKTRAETEEEKEIINEIIKFYSHKTIRNGIEDELYIDAKNGLIHKVFSVNEGFKGYAKYPKDESFVTMFYKWYRKNREMRALSAVINDDTFIARIMYYAAFEKDYKMHGYHEMYRFCFQRGEIWVENRDGCKRIKPGFVYAGGREIQNIEFADTQKVLNDLLKVYPEDESMIFLNTDLRHVNTLLMKFDSMVRPDRIYKCVPEDIKESLVSDRCKYMNGKFNKYHGFISDYNATVERYGEHGLLFRNWRSYGNIVKECERMYYRDGKTYWFVYEPFLKKFVSTKNHGISSLRKTEFTRLVYIDTQEPDSVKIDKNILTYGSINIGKKHNLFRDAGAAISASGDVLLVRLETLENMSKSLAGEQAIKIGYPWFTENVVFKKSDREMSKLKLSDFLGFQAKYIHLLSPSVWAMRLSSKEIYEIFQNYKQMIPDPELRVKAINVFKTNFDNLDWLRKYYDDCGKDYLPLLKSILNRDKDKQNTERHNEKTDNYYDPYLYPFDDVAKPGDGFWFIQSDNQLSPAAILQEYKDYSLIRQDANKYLGEERFGRFLKAGQIHKMHYKALTFFRKQQEANANSQFEKKLYKVCSSKTYMRNLDFKDKKYMICGVRNANDLMSEGKTNHNCVGSYVRDMAEGKTYIYFLRKTAKPEETYYTIEVRKRQMKQCYGINNTIDNNEERRAYIKKWADSHKIKISCDY